MRYGILEDEDSETDSYQWNIKIENEIEGLKSQIAFLNAKFLHNSDRLCQLELTKAQKEVRKRASISAVHYHKNAGQHEFTPKFYACQTKKYQIKEAEHYPSDRFCKTQAQTENHTFNGFGPAFPIASGSRPAIPIASGIQATPISASSIHQKTFGNHPGFRTSEKFPELTQEKVLIELLNQIGKIESKMSDMVDRFTSVQSQMHEVSSRLSFMDLRMSTVDLCLTMQRYMQKWQDLKPTIDKLSPTEKPLDQDGTNTNQELIKQETNTFGCSCNINESKTVSDEPLIILSDEYCLARDGFSHFKEKEKSDFQLERDLDKIILSVTDSCPAFASSNLIKTTHSVDENLANSTDVFIKTEMNNSANSLDSGERIKPPLVNPSTDNLPNGNYAKSDGNAEECTKQNNNSTDKNNCNGIINRIPVQTASTVEYAINLETKGGCGEDFENLHMPLLLEENYIEDKQVISPGGDGENETLVVTESDEQETTRHSEPLENRESINICHDIVKDILHEV